jgi:hypothetical protein
MPWSTGVPSIRLNTRSSSPNVFPSMVYSASFWARYLRRYSAREGERSSRLRLCSGHAGHPAPPLQAKLVTSTTKGYTGYRNGLARRVLPLCDIPVNPLTAQGACWLCRFALRLVSTLNTFLSNEHGIAPPIIDPVFEKLKQQLAVLLPITPWQPS